MLIGICGPICSGKHTTAEYLVQHHGFLRLHLPSQIHQTSLPSALRHDQHSSSDDNVKRLLPSVTDEKGTRGLTFPDVDSLLDFVTKRWREHWVLTDIHDETTLEALLRRPFFLLVSVDAPVSLRYQRFSQRCARRGLDPMPLLDFITTNDFQLYGTISNVEHATISPPTKLNGHASKPYPLPNDINNNERNNSSPKPSETFHGTAHLLSRAHLQILNSAPSVATYNNFLDTLDLPSSIRLRPTWDAYFMTLASLASRRSNCMKRRVGCVLVHDSRIISTGYNGTPRNLRNCNEGGCERCNLGSSGGSALSTCLCLHAEENALLEAGRERIRSGAVLYCDTCPCLTCSVKIAQVGVKEVVYSQTYNMDDASRKVLKQAGVELRQYIPPKSGLVGFDVGFDTDGKDFGEVQEIVLRNGRH